jgi:BMFP domain-containing protein YqiC
VNQRLIHWIGSARTELAQGGPAGALSKCGNLSILIQENPMSFMNSSALDDLARRLADAVPESVRAVGRDMESNFKAVLQSGLSKLDLVSRQEFDVQAALLARTQAKLAALEERLTTMEGKLPPA